MARLEGKVCIVTGAGSRTAGIGTGCATAVAFAREGGRVVVVDIEERAARRTMAMIAAADGQADVFVGDLTDATAVAAMVDRVAERWGRVDVLQNNLGIHGPGSVLEVSEEEWAHVMQVNVTSMMLVSKHVLPVMIDQGGGSITNVSSISALRPRGLTPYSVSKGAVIALTRAMAVDHGGDGVRVNCIAPGPLHTPMVAAGDMPDELRERRRRASLLAIEGTAWDVAHAAVYLASDEARYVTGVTLPVDGGVMLRASDR